MVPRSHHEAHMAAHTAAHANPFDMMNSHMSQMMGQFDRMGMGGGFGGSMLGGSMFGGGMGGGTCCGSMGGGGACSSSYRLRLNREELLICVDDTRMGVLLSFSPPPPKAPLDRVCLLPTLRRGLLPVDC